MPSAVAAMGATAHLSTDSNNPSTQTFSSKSKIIRGEIIKQGIIEAFPAQFDKHDKPYTFEPSAAYTDNNYLYLFNDRALPKPYLSPLIKLNVSELENEFIGANKIVSVNSDLIKTSKKFESATRSLDGKTIIASTSFTYSIKDKPKKDKYSRILYWPINQADSAKLISPTRRKNTESSLNLREPLKNALKTKDFPSGPDYIKIEGLSILPDNKLLFGIRNMGKCYECATFQFILVEATIKKSSVKNWELVDFKRVYQLDNFTKFPKVKETLGISSIEYSSERNGIFILSSFEIEKDKQTTKIGAYLWFYSLENKSIKLIRRTSGEPLKFDHKAEALVVLNKNRLLIIHDDDRETKFVNLGTKKVKRQVNQAVFSIVSLSE